MSICTHTPPESLMLKSLTTEELLKFVDRSNPQIEALAEALELELDCNKIEGNI